MADSVYEKELQAAIQAVHKASILTKAVTNSHKTGAFSKTDSSPVTIADFAAQATLISIVKAIFPDDEVVGEENATALREDGALRDDVWRFVQDAGTPLNDVNEMMDVVDLGGSGEGCVNGGRCWMLDPVDGTAAYVKGEQYAASLALIVDGVQKVGVLGCPNLSLEKGCVREDLVDSHGLGWIIYAVEGQGAWRRKMSMDGLGEEIVMQRVKDEQRSLKWIESQTKNRDIDRQRAVATAMGAEWPGTDIWSMQMKYMALAVGGNDVLVRISPRDYRGYVWDHAGGQLICSEVGIVIQDLSGKPFDFGQGRRLENNWGVVAARPGLFERVMKEVREVVDV